MKRPDPFEFYYGASQIGERLGFTAATVRQWLREGFIPRKGAIVIRGEQRIPWSTLQPWIEALQASAPEQFAKLILNTNEQEHESKVLGQQGQEVAPSEVHETQGCGERRAVQ